MHQVARLPLVGHSAVRQRVERHLEVRNIAANFVVRTDPGITMVPLEPVDAVEPLEVLLVWNADRALERPVAPFVDATLDVCRELALAPTAS